MLQQSFDSSLFFYPGELLVKHLLVQHWERGLGGCSYHSDGGATYTVFGENVKYQMGLRGENKMFLVVQVNFVFSLLVLPST